MATTPAVGRVPGHDRRVWFVTAAAVAVLVVGFVLHSVLRDPGTIEQQIGHQVYDASGNYCFTTVTANEQVARRWPQASKAEIIGWIRSGRLRHDTMQATGRERVAVHGNAAVLTARRRSSGAPPRVRSPI